MASALILAAIFILSMPGAWGRAECAALKSRAMGAPVQYCALLPASYDADPKRTYPILYWLHGLGGSAQSFVDEGGWNLVEQMREAGQLGEFIIITPDGDATFFVNSRDGRRPYEDFFLREFMPAMERQYRIHKGREWRGIGGASMGGYGSLHMAFAHPELFGSVSAHFGALIDRVSPAILTGGTMRFMNRAFGDPFDVRYWDTNNPVRLAEHASGLAGMKIYFDCGSQDDFGFEVGAKALDRILSSRKIAHEFHIYPGGHDWKYIAQHMPASLAFHWRVFSAARP